LQYDCYYDIQAYRGDVSKVTQLVAMNNVREAILDDIARYAHGKLVDAVIANPDSGTGTVMGGISFVHQVYDDVPPTP
jgi:hypothetical protein